MLESLDLKFLYYFSCASICVLEVKILGLEEEAPPGRVYHWLCYDRVSQQFQKLGFKSMGSDGGRAYRKFEQGELWFDASQADLTLTSDTGLEEFTLEVNGVDSIPDEFIALVQYFLQHKLSAC